MRKIWGVGVNLHPDRPGLIFPPWWNVRKKATVATLCPKHTDDNYCRPSPMYSMLHTAKVKRVGKVSTAHKRQKTDFTLALDILSLLLFLRPRSRYKVTKTRWRVYNFLLQSPPPHPLWSHVMVRLGRRRYVWTPGRHTARHTAHFRPDPVESGQKSIGLKLRGPNCTPPLSNFSTPYRLLG